jgi:subtilisin family serine protease
MRPACQVFRLSIVFFAFFIISCFPTSGYTQNASNRPHWVIYTQKRTDESIAISEKAWNRRILRSSLVDFAAFDTPLNSEYVWQTESIVGMRIRTVSRWLNAVSIEADNATLERVSRLPFVSEILPVSSHKFDLPIPADIPQYGRGKIAAFDYGPSFTQDSMLAVDSLHNLGLSGDGVLIGIMDTGFDTSHAAFANMRAENRIVATHDFINGDDDVMDLWDSQRSHGTSVFSVLGGFDEGFLIGPAFGAEYILAKTEILSGNDQQAEEDYWIAAAEWMESLGVDIISSSVGYIDWYDTTQLDGHTPLITRAADIAASLGVIVVNSAGNEGGTAWRKIIPPADGDSVIAVGGVDRGGTIIGFSSRGPTADGRIKPDFCALGGGVFHANYAGGYATSSGTSFSAPLIAGGIALLMEGHPEWDYYDFTTALRQAADHSFLPNNDYGWGIPNFVAAYNRQPFRPSGTLSISVAPHPAVDSVIFYLKLASAVESVLSIHDISGAQVREWTLQPGAASFLVQRWDGRNKDGKQVASGVYICVLRSGDEIVREKLAYIRK